MAIATPEQAQFIVDLRLRIQANKDAGLPEHTGIERDDIKRFVSIIRQNRANAPGPAKVKANARGKVAPASDQELKDLFSL